MSLRRVSPYHRLEDFFREDFFRCESHLSDQDLVSLFAQVEGAIDKLTIFQRAITSYVDIANWGERDRIARILFYQLPSSLQEDLKRHIWLANYRDDEGHGISFGDHIINTDIRGEITQRALGDYLMVLKNEMNADQRQKMDEDNIEFILSHFHYLAPIPDNEIIDICVNRCNQINNPIVQLRAFQAIVRFIYINPHLHHTMRNRSLFRSTYLKRKLYEHIWIANGRNDEGHGMHFWWHIFQTPDRYPLLLRAAESLIAHLGTLPK